MKAQPIIVSFVEAWVTRNMRVVTGANTVAAVDGFAASLTGAARAEGISGSELHRALGDIDDFLTVHYQRVCQDDPPEGR